MKNGALPGRVPTLPAGLRPTASILGLVAVAGAVVLNGLFLDRLPMWRQLAFGGLAVAAYLHGRHLPVRRGWVVLGAAALVAAGVAVVNVATAAGALIALGVFAVLPWLAGRFRFQQAELVRAGAERVAQLERQQEFVAANVRLRERARIAADMHDSLGHELALIALQAGALELATDMTPRNREAVARLRSSAVTATDRLRHTVSLLRTDDGGVPPEIAGESLDALVARVRDAGMTVRLHDGGTPAAAPAAERAIHRVVQEALTNAARHAPGTEVDVRVERGRDGVRVSVRNPVAGPPRAPLPGGGTGLAGLREHVGVFGGDLRAGAADGAFTVTAWLPAGVATTGRPR